MLRLIPLALLLTLAGCSLSPFKSGSPAPSAGTVTRPTGSAPVLTTPTDVQQPAPEQVIEAPAPAQLPRERPRTPPATLSPASRALVSQAEAQRKKGDLPGATVSLERALRIEPRNPLLWIEMGRLRMDQRNFVQAENMGRKAMAMAVGDDASQSAAWQLIGDSYKARGQNPQAEAAYERSRQLSVH